MSEQPTGEKGGLSESLRAAIERTLEATGRSASDARERAEALVGEVNTPAPADLRQRAEELLDEVARLGQETGERFAQRGRDAREAVARRVDEIRPASEPELQRVAEQLAELERRVEVLEGEPKPDAEG